jgi:hypothetical protein
MQLLELRSGLDHIGQPIFAEAKELAIIGPGRGSEAGPRLKTLASVNLLAGAGVVAGEESAIVQGIVIITVDNGRRVIRTARGQIPLDEL